MKKDGFVYDFHNKDFIFMRWKEHFLVPDHRVRTINGASFAGFYYICYQLSTGVITGFYFHKSSERYVLSLVKKNLLKLLDLKEFRVMF
jgi:hypothetical protein